MSTSTLITILIILLIILIPLLLCYLVFPDEKVTKKLSTKKKTTTTKPKVSKDTPLSFEEIANLFARSDTSADELKEAIEQLVKHHGKIHAKLGDLPHPDYKRYLALIINLCKNKQADKDIILSLDQKLRAKNPKYGLDIDDAVNKGIAGRGF